MTPSDTVRKYPCLARVVLAVNDDSDLIWAGQIIEAARKPGMSRDIVREAVRKRHNYKLGPAAYRDVERLVRSIPTTQTMCQV